MTKSVVTILWLNFMCRSCVDDCSLITFIKKCGHKLSHWGYKALTPHCLICLSMKSNLKASKFWFSAIINSDHSNFLSISTTDKSPLAQTLGSPALQNCLVTQRLLLPRANERRVRCPLNKLRMPPSKETCSAPVSAATGSCLPGLSLKFLVKDYMWKELERLRGPRPFALMYSVHV